MLTLDCANQEATYTKTVTYLAPEGRIDSVRHAAFLTRKALSARRGLNEGMLARPFPLTSTV